MRLVPDPDNIRIVMLGMVAENGHSFSWSAIVNGQYDSSTINSAGYPMISNYLAAQPPESLGINGVNITHVWCEDYQDSKAVAKSANIANIVDKPTDVIGNVDAVIIPTDKGEEHYHRVKPFVEAGIPVFIDKPMTTETEHLRQFIDWRNSGKIICSSSALRYAHEFSALRKRLNEVGEVRLIVATCAKSWERYGIHALESIYGLLHHGGWIDVYNTGTDKTNMVHIRHGDGVEVMICQADDMFGGFCHATVYGTKSRLDAI